MYSDEEFDILKSKILRYVLYKKRTEKEVQKKFEKEQSEILEDAIEYLKELGYINDKDYIDRSIKEHIRLNNLSLKELQYKLLTKGIEKQQLEDYLQDNKEELEEYETNSAKNIIQKKLNSMEKEEVYSFLLKKGYKKENIKEAFKEIEE